MGLLSKAISIQVITGRSGGLMRKLTVCSARIDDDPGNGDAPSGLKPSGAGLLRKSLLFLNLDHEEQGESESLLIVGESAQIDRLLEKIDLLTRDFSYFPELYSLLVRDFSLPRSALFLYNGLRQRFTPWLSRGLDPALSTALEFSGEQWREPLTSSFRLESGRRLFPALARELPQPLYLFPFVHQGSLEGSLLVSNFAVPPQNREAIEVFFQTLSRKVGTSIAQIMKTLKGLNRPHPVFPSPEAALPALLEPGSHRPDTFLVLNIQLDPLFAALVRNNGFFDRLRFREIVLHVVNAYLSHLGAAVPRGEGNIVLVLRASRYFSPQLLTATLSLLLSDVFKGLFRSPPALAPSRVFEYPACGMKPLEIAAAL